ncbi:acetyl esterase/lipase [Maribacter vaceletii]|uniref:Acetyl esterase/lipase n=1 Tax=Maribacter vaceletii TaxID=1206816 RepID=A0A495DTP9_9FLAO|nr:alpha/beta hydrolase [Maribacter vaceletii]RKR08002.1 acetyl esterase/lipase [Maribacter vaceletii]
MKFISIKRYLIVVMSLTVFGCASKERVIELWPEGKIPNHIKTEEKEVHEQTNILRIKNVQTPTIEVFLPDESNATGKAMLIFPGGGYGLLAYDWEGTDIAKFLNNHGIAGIVVKYRLPSDKTQTKKHTVPLIDAQRAIRLVRSRAEDWNIDKNEIGIIGFSAGGHVASTLGTQYNKNVYEPIDKIDELSARPDFMALIYPVITMGEKTHKGSKKKLLGENPSEALVNAYSNHLHINKETPVTFLVHAIDDKAVPKENSEFFHGLMSTQGEGMSSLYLYKKGGHGFSLAKEKPHLKEWSKKLISWVNELESD